MTLHSIISSRTSILRSSTRILGSTLSSSILSSKFIYNMLNSSFRKIDGLFVLESANYSNSSTLRAANVRRFASYSMIEC